MWSSAIERRRRRPAGRSGRACRTCSRAGDGVAADVEHRHPAVEPGVPGELVRDLGVGLRQPDLGDLLLALDGLLQVVGARVVLEQLLVLVVGADVIAALKLDLGQIIERLHAPLALPLAGPGAGVVRPALGVGVGEALEEVAGDAVLAVDGGEGLLGLVEVPLEEQPLGGLEGGGVGRLLLGRRGASSPRARGPSPAPSARRASGRSTGRSANGRAASGRPVSDPASASFSAASSSAPRQRAIGPNPFWQPGTAARSPSRAPATATRGPGRGPVAPEHSTSVSGSDVLKSCSDPWEAAGHRGGHEAESRRQRAKSKEQRAKSKEQIRNEEIESRSESPSPPLRPQAKPNSARCPLQSGPFLCSQLSVLCSLPSALCSLPSAFCLLLSAFCSLPSALCSLLSVLRPATPASTAAAAASGP